MALAKDLEWTVYYYQKNAMFCNQYYRVLYIIDYYGN